MVNFIGSLLDRNERVSSLVSSEFRHLIRNGSNIDFWTDNWMGRGVLKIMFPRIFALATTKHGLISLFGHWVDGDWSWDVQLRRSPLNWDRDVWEEFNSLLEEIILDVFARDRLIWSPSATGIYSCKSFRRELQEYLLMVPIWKATWRIPVPLKVEMFM